MINPNLENRSETNKETFLSRENENLSKEENCIQPNRSQLEDALASQFDEESSSVAVIDSAKIRSEVIRGDQTQPIY